METVEQVNENFDVKKPKKKGLLIGLILVTVIVVALALVYFLVLTNPKFIFSKTIDKLFTVDLQSYDSAKIETKIKVDADLEDTTYDAELVEIEKCALTIGAQMDAKKKQEIVDLGLDYDNKAVIDARVYYDDGEMYAYFEDVFDKYIEVDLDEETKAALDEIFEMATSEETLKDTEKAITIAKDEFKAQIKENGEFEKEKDKIDVGEDEVNVSKITLTLTEKQLYKIAGNMFTNLANNNEFIKCFEESPKDLLKDAAAELKDLEGNSKNNVKISLYTKGLLNKLVAVDMEIYTADEDSTIIAAVVKEDNDVYSYKAIVKSSGIKMDLVKGKVEIEKDKDAKKEQSGKMSITAEVNEFGSVKLEINYSCEYDQGIDKVDISNSVNINDITETDLQSAVAKLIDRPLIGDVIENLMKVNVEDDFLIDPDTETNVEKVLTTSQNEVKDDYYGYSVTYTVPAEFKYREEYSYEYSKYFEIKDADYSSIDANVSLVWQTENEYIEDDINWDYNYYLEDTEYYKNVNLSEVKSVVVGDKTFKYAILSYESNFGYGSESKYQDAYVWYPLGEEHIFTVEFEATDKVVSEDMIKGFLNINVTELN